MGTECPLVIHNEWFPVKVRIVDHGPWAPSTSHAAHIAEVQRVSRTETSTDSVTLH
jgi:hypothetical protein